MYRLLCCLLLCFSLSVSEKVFAANRNIITEHHQVKGVCEKCKKRIEYASYIKGVKFAEWNVDSNDLTLVFDSTKTTSMLIMQSIVKSGHDADSLKATNEDYDKLPHCCKYRSGIKKH
ncbi:MAG: hypothetical protein WCG87_09725 [Bacteroidota bacterium]